MTNTTVSIKEINKFEQMAEDWWNPIGKFKPLHDLSPIRLKYITDLIKQHFSISSIKELHLLDIGCGGGLIAEPLAKLGATITAIDASEININIAKAHANQTNITLNSHMAINYQAILAEELVKNSEKFPVVLALEIIEHVENIELFIETCCKLVAPGGLLILSTMNQTIKSYLQSILAAEYILKWLPIGTHSWSKFVKPSEINKIASLNNMTLLEMKGISYQLHSNNWTLSDDIDNNYFISFAESHNR